MDGNIEKNQAVYNLTGKILSIPTVDKTFSKNGYAADAKLTGEALEERVKKTDIVDNLASDSDTLPLSARQGKVIKGLLDDMATSGAGSVGYDNTDSGLEATNMQSAIDELAEGIKTQTEHIDDLALDMDNFEQNYLSKKGGGMITGSLQVQNADNGHGAIGKNNSATADYGTQLMDVRKDGKSSKVTVSATTGLLSYTDVDNNIRNIHHEGNKPFLEYKGDGTATTRTIATKGFGRLALLYCSSHCSLVTPKGAIVTDLSTGGMSWIDSGKLSFFNGNLVIGTANDACNKANETYYCQVI